MKGLVIYYSNKGSNRYLARRIVEKTGYDMEEIRPRINALFPLIMASLTKVGVGNRKIKSDIASYDTIILCGPIWMGQIISPLRNFIRKYKSQIKNLYFVSCCGVGDDQKNSKFGYGTVFSKMADLLGNRFIRGVALPIKMLVKPGQSDDEIMKIRLTKENFTGEIEKRFNDAMDVLLKESSS